MNRETLIKWNNNRNINPLTNKKIKSNGKIYLNFLKEWDKLADENLLGPLKNYIDCEDNKDVISQEDIWVIKDGKRVKSEDIKYLFSYKDEEGKYRGFNITSIEKMIENGIYKHPITNKEIGSKDILRAKEFIKKLYQEGELKEQKENKEKKEIDNMIYNFNKLGYFLDERWFKKLVKPDYLKLDYEIGDLLKNNIDKENYQKIKGFKMNKQEVNLMTEEKLKLKIYREINEILEMEIKVFGGMIIICGLGMVIKEIEQRYNDIMAFN